MTAERIQRLVDSLGSRLRRSVAVDDHMLNLVAVGQDYGDSDPARMWSLLNRRTRPEDVGYSQLRAAPGPTRIEPNEELGLKARICVPVRYEGTLLGLMWIIEPEQPLTGEQLADAVETATAIGVLLQQRMLIHDRDTVLASYLLDELLSDDPERTAQAAAGLVQHGFVADDSHVAVMVVGTEEPAGASAAVLAQAVHRAGRSASPGSWLSSMTPQRATVLLTGARPIEADLAAAALRLSGYLNNPNGATPDQGPAWQIALGGTTQGLAGAAISRQQATITMSVNRRRHGCAKGECQVSSWAELGPYRLIGQLSPAILGGDSLPLGLFTLLRSEGASPLLDTLERFLDCAGDKQRAARELDIHRTTLYYRLDRIEAITGMSLSSGADRLLLHLAVKLHRLGPGSVKPARVAPDRRAVEHRDG